MSPSHPDLALLLGTDRRSIGRANEVAELAKNDPDLLKSLIAEMANADPVLAMRCADATEKVSREQPALLEAHKPTLLTLLAEIEQHEVRWHLAQMLCHLQLSSTEAQQAFDSLLTYFADKSSIVKTSALQALHDLALAHPELKPAVEQQIQAQLLTGTPAMQARARKLLKSNH